VSTYVPYNCIHFNLYTLNHWNLMISLNLKKYNWITNGEYEKKFEQLCQIKLLEKQVEKFINPLKVVSVIASFPLMLVGFYGSTRFEDLP